MTHLVFAFSYVFRLFYWPICEQYFIDSALVIKCTVLDSHCCYFYSVLSVLCNNCIFMCVL